MRKRKKGTVRERQRVAERERGGQRVRIIEATYKWRDLQIIEIVREKATYTKKKPA